MVGSFPAREATQKFCVLDAQKRKEIIVELTLNDLIMVFLFSFLLGFAMGGWITVNIFMQLSNPKVEDADKT